MRGERINEDFKVDDSMRSWAEANVSMVNIEAETGKFVDYHLAKGTTMVNWTAAWRTWMRNAVTFKGAIHYTADQIQLKRLRSEYMAMGFRAPRRHENSIMYAFEYEVWTRGVRDKPRDMSVVAQLNDRMRMKTA